MEKSTQKKDLENHIKALKCSYDNLISILNQPLAMVDVEGEQKIALKDSQKKTYAEGIQKSSDAADDLFQKIKTKKLELEELLNPDGKKKKKEHDSNQSDLNTRLR